MNKIFKIAPLLTALACPLIASAEYVDVIELKLKDTCTMTKYLDIVKDFNTQMMPQGYKAEILTPIHSSNLESIFWLGRSKNSESFGKVSDAYSNAVGDANTTEGKLSARLRDCTTSIARRSYRTR